MGPDVASLLRRSVFWALVPVIGISVLTAGALLMARDDAVVQERRDVELVSAVLAVTTDPEALRSAVARTKAGAEGRMVLRLADGTTIGTTPRSSTRTTGRSLTAGDESPVELELTASPFRPPIPELVVLLVALAVAGAAGLLLASRLVQPFIVSLSALTAAARAGQRVRLHGPSDLVALAEAITEVADRARQSIDREREMVADVSHRLRTPLTALRLDVDSIGDGPAAQRVHASVVAMEREVDRMIRSFCAPSTSGPEDGCDLAGVVRARMEFWSAHAEQQGRTCDLSVPAEEAPVGLGRDAVEAVLDTLLENIFLHTRPPAPLSVEVVRHAGWVRLVVEDGGTGIADTEAALRRGTSARGSTGLGLAIARAAAESTGGNVQVDRGRLGGARIRLSFNELGHSPDAEGPKAWRLWTRTR
ncbi:sensor histidine kinase [Lentzea sp. NPDC059081]|uniref:sensor histidine kinase n=1 Tax=Lentzea sp. NPDC059081 TaxID=3346719 RepID=UPI0036C5B222